MMKKEKSIRDLVDDFMVCWIYIACLVVGPASLFLCPPFVTLGILASAIVCIFLTSFGGLIGLPMFFIAFGQIAFAVKDLAQ